MILQALAEYYSRKASDSKSCIAPEGFQYKELPFIIVLDAKGAFVNIEDTRQIVNKKPCARSFLVPQGEKRSSGVKAYLLWDTVEYALGICCKDKNLEKVAKKNAAFIQKIESLNLANDLGIEAVLQFLKNTPQLSISSSIFFDEIIEKNPFISFRLNTEVELICQQETVINRRAASTPAIPETSFCLISGKNDVRLNLQPSIVGVRGTNTTGGNIVSFNHDAFNSFGKKQGNNAPMGQEASFAYTTALNHLLKKDSTQKFQVADATTVFWSDKQSTLENDFNALFDEPSKDNPDRLTHTVRALLKAVDSGIMPPAAHETQFFILGLSPNAARISVRFWHRGTVAECNQTIAQHFRDLDIIHSPKERDHLSIWWLLRSVAALGNSDNIQPNLAGDWVRAILNGSAYPATLFQSALRRIHAKREVSYERAAIIKAYLNRQYRSKSSQEKEITVSLDTENTNPGYRIGRLFAVLEKIQEEASPSINSTIRDRYYSSGSGTPAHVFPILMRMKNHHLSKLVPGRTIFFEKLLANVISELSANGFPAQLNLSDQGCFAIGYYHQRQAFFIKPEITESHMTD